MITEALMAIAGGCLAVLGIHLGSVAMLGAASVDCFALLYLQTARKRRQ